jgi:hypothetical protein
MFNLKKLFYFSLHLNYRELQVRATFGRGFLLPPKTVEAGAYASTLSALYDRQRSTPSPDSDSAIAIAAMRS